MTIHQPCPKCGTLMEWVVDAHETGEGEIWRCPICKTFWSSEKIEDEYAQNDLADAEENADDYAF